MRQRVVPVKHWIAHARISVLHVHLGSQAVLACLLLLALEQILETLAAIL
jgi:hypothetical protein